MNDSEASRPAHGFTQLPIQWVAEFFPGGKVAGVRSYHSTPPSVELYIYSSIHLHGMDIGNFTVFNTVVPHLRLA